MEFIRRFLQHVLPTGFIDCLSFVQSTTEPCGALGRSFGSTGSTQGRGYGNWKNGRFLTPRRSLRDVPGKGRGVWAASGYVRLAKALLSVTGTVAARSEPPVLISRTAGYATRMSGGVGGGSREATPYPDWRSRLKSVCFNIHSIGNKTDLSFLKFTKTTFFPFNRNSLFQDRLDWGRDNGRLLWRQFICDVPRN